MRGHSHDVDEGRELRPKADRIEAEDTGLMYKAATAGRADVLGPVGLLGLQRTVGNAGVASVMEEERSPVLDVIGSDGGAPLDNDTRTDMESRLGHDFSDVRVHNDSRAHESARAVNAHAYTVGSNIVFQRDKYDPSSTEGRTMLAHELTHVVQRAGGRHPDRRWNPGQRPVGPVQARGRRQCQARHLRARSGRELSDGAGSAAPGGRGRAA